MNTLVDSKNRMRKSLSDNKTVLYCDNGSKENNKNVVVVVVVFLHFCELRV